MNDRERLNKTTKRISGWLNLLIDDAIITAIILSICGSWWIAIGVAVLFNSLTYTIRHAGES